MNQKEMMAVIAAGEGINIEFKRADFAIPKDLYDTVCAFNNRNGGYIFLGVGDAGDICGVDADAVDKILKNFATAMNNPNKISPPLHLTPETICTEDGKIVICIRVPEGESVCRHSGRIWDRSHESDIDITDNQNQVFKLYARKSGSSSTDRVLSGWGMEKLDPALIDRARKRALGLNKEHLWKNMTVEEILRSVNLILTDQDTGKEGLTLAAVLLFGTDRAIGAALPQHKTDAIFRIQNIDRYDDREVIVTNLLDSYERLIAFGQKHLNDPFVLDGIQRVSARDRILREIVSNSLAHRDYISNEPAKLVIEKERIYTENSNRANGFGPLSLETFKPVSKNPSISRVFREIGMADELGSGMRNAYKYTKLYSGGTPIFEEGDTFRTIIPIEELATAKVGILVREEAARYETGSSLREDATRSETDRQQPSQKEADADIVRRLIEDLRAPQRFFG